jgi:predicted sugar kinase
MYLSLGVPAVLPLGLVALEHEGQRRICLFGATLQHPPSHIFAYRTDEFVLTGARVQDALPHVTRFIDHHGVSPSATVEFELATVKFMGLGASPLIGLGAARALAWASGLSYEDSVALADAVLLPPSYALELWAFDRGGLLCVETPVESEGLPRVLRRFTIRHEVKDDWVFVFHLPHVPSDAPAEPDLAQRTNLLESIPRLDRGRLEEASRALESAIVGDQLDSFADALADILAVNRAALEAQGTSYPDATDEDRRVLGLMKDCGALIADRAPLGLARFALIRGAHPSLEMRTRMRAELGFGSGTIMGTIVDNEGARHVIRDEPVRMRFLQSEMAR